jgi:signal transduction histidine kinase
MVETAAFDRAFEAKNSRMTMTLFEFRDGYRGVQPRDTPRAAVEGGDGRLWFVTTAGTVWIDPAHLPKNRIAPPTAISAVKVRGITYRDPTALRLPSGSSNIEIDFAALSLSIPDRVKVLYRMAGVDNEWVDPGSRRQAFFTNLAPGRYLFQVVAANDNDVWNRTGSSLSIEITPSFVQSDWFKAIVAIAAVLLLWCGYLVRIGQLTARIRVTLETRLAERERIARDLHDTLLQGFQGLILHFQSIANEIPNTQRSRSLLDEALNKADNILAEGRDSVSHLRTIGHMDLAEAFAETAERLQRDYPLKFNLTQEGIPRELHPVVRAELMRIGDEALVNAFRHSAGTSVELTVSYRPSALILGVHDDGVGIQASILEQGGRQGHFGLVGMRERAQQIKSNFQVSARPGKGTKIQVATPGRVAYASGRRTRWINLLRPAPDQTT